MRIRHLLVVPILLLTLAIASSRTIADPPAASPTAPQATPSAKAPIPAAAALASAAKLVDDVYKDDLAAAKTPDQKLALAQKMLDAAKDEKDPAALYTLMTKTVNLACEAGDLQSACAVVDSLNNTFNIDALKLKADSASYIARTAATPELKKQSIALATPLVDAALDADRYDIAQALSTTLVETARDTKDAPLLSTANARLQQVRSAEQAFADANKALEVLAEKPDDPGANLKVGTYHCLIKGNWDRGLPMFALSTDDTLKTLAKTEIAGPTTVDDQVKLADAWWDLSEKNTGSAKNQLQAHAAQWYQAAMPNLAGLGKMRIEKRLASAKSVGDPPTQTATPRTIDLLALVDPAKDAVAGKWSLKDGVLSTGVTPQGRLEIPYHPPAEYDVHVEFTRESGNDVVAVFLVGGGNQFFWFMGGWHNTVNGLEVIGDLPGDANGAAVHVPTALVNGQRYDLVLKVRKTGVTAFVGGKLMSSCKTDYSNIHVHPAWPLKDALALGVGASISATRFSKIEVKEISGIGEFTRQLASKPSTPRLIASTTPPPAPGLQAPRATLQPFTSPTTPASPTSPPQPPSAVPTTPALPFNPNAIERPEFANIPKPIVKNITSISSMMVRVSDDGDTLGLTTDIIASVAPDTRNSRDGGAGFMRSKVGEEMKTSFEEAVRAVKLRYPTWEGGRIDISFGEKYTEHDGGSAGTAFGVLLLSSLEGFEIDPKCAVTGDITVDWKVRKVTGVASKIHGAILDKCLYAAIPASNEEVINDLPLLYGENSLWDIQVLSIPTLQQAVATVRTDRAPQLAEALNLFATLQPALSKSGRAALRTPATIDTLKRVVQLAPNHLSAKALLAIADKTAPTTLSSSASLYRFSIIAYPYRDFLNGRRGIDRASLPPSVTANARKQIDQLRRIGSKEIQPLITDMSGLIEAAEDAAARKFRSTDLDRDRDALLAHLAAVSANKELLEKLVREGY